MAWSDWRLDLVEDDPGLSIDDNYCCLRERFGTYLMLMVEYGVGSPRFLGFIGIRPSVVLVGECRMERCEGLTVPFLLLILHYRMCIYCTPIDELRVNVLHCTNPYYLL